MTFRTLGRAPSGRAAPGAVTRANFRGGAQNQNPLYSTVRRATSWHVLACQQRGVMPGHGVRGPASPRVFHARHGAAGKRAPRRYCTVHYCVRPPAARPSPPPSPPRSVAKGTVLYCYCLHGVGGGRNECAGPPLPFMPANCGCPFASSWLVRCRDASPELWRYCSGWRTMRQQT
jgi:hypothetical protein